MKKADERQIVYGIVLEPETGDSQNDVISANKIEKAAHYYMEHHRLMKEQHDQENLLLSPVEPYIAPADFVIGEQRVRKVQPPTADREASARADWEKKPSLNFILMT